MPSQTAYQYNEDLFEDTKMTFGQHLEELRAALLKAVLALVIGFIIGLLIGDHVVRFIESPLKNSLLTYYHERDVDKLREVIAAKVEAGEAVPGDINELAEFMARNHLTFDSLMVDGPEFMRELKRQYPETFKDVVLPELPKATKTDDPGTATGAAAAAGKLDEGKLMRLFVWREIKDTERAKLTTLNAQEAFMIYVKAALIFGFLLASPFIFWYVWDFIRVGLYPHERRYVNIFLPMSIGLFLSGAALAFFVVFKYVLDFLFGFNKWLGLEPDMRISEWLSFALFMPVGFGLSFQLPLVMLFLERIGVFSVEVYLSKWRISVLVIAIISMILTPADPVSMMLMATPLWLLYFFGVALCRYMPRGKSPFADQIA